MTAQLLKRLAIGASVTGLRTAHWSCVPNTYQHLKPFTGNGDISNVTKNPRQKKTNKQNVRIPRAHVIYLNDYASDSGIYPWLSTNRK